MAYGNKKIMNIISRGHQWVLDATDHARHCNFDAQLSVTWLLENCGID